MSYAFAGCAPCALGAPPQGVALTEWWVGASWQRNNFSGQSAKRTQRMGDVRLDQWLALHCVGGQLVYVSSPYEGGQKLDVYAGSTPLPAGFSSWPGAPVLEPYACPGGAPPPAQPPPASQSEDELLIASACVGALAQKQDVTLPRPAKDPATGKMVIAVRYVPEGAGDCALVFQRGPWWKIALAAGAGVAVGYVGYKVFKRRRQ